MITDNIKNIFRFIEFLHLNIEHFNNQKPILDEISQLRKEFHDLDPKINYEHTFIRKELKEKEDELEALFYNECRKGIREKAIELNIINFNDSSGGGFVNLGELIILVHTRDYDRDDVEIILRAKENYVSVLTKVKVDLNRFLTYGIIRDFKDDLFDCFKPFLTDYDKTALGKFKDFDDFLSFCEPQLKNFQLGNDSLEMIKPFENKLSKAITDDQINEVKTIVEFGIAKTKLILTQFIERENITMNFQDIKKIENDTVLEAVSLYHNYQRLYNDAHNKIEALKSNKLHFETFPEFLNYFKNNFNDVEIDEKHSEAKRLFEQKKLKLENSSFQSEIDEVKVFSEKAFTDFKNRLMLSFKNENYKTKFNGGINPNLIAIGKLYFEYENLYNSAKNKSDIFNYLSTLSKEEIEEKRQNSEAFKRFCEKLIDYSKYGSWSVGNLPIEFETITKVDLFVENFIKSIEILAKEGKDVHQLIDLFIQTTKTDLENPLLEKNVKINRHLFNKLEGVKLLLSNVMALPSKQENITTKEKQFSVLEWATIFYYADETKLLTDDKTIKARIEKFMIKHQIITSFNSFKNNYNTAKKRINTDSDFPIQKLGAIIPFAKENYNKVVAKIENDILYLKNNNND